MAFSDSGDTASVWPEIYGISALPQRNALIVMKSDGDSDSGETASMWPEMSVSPPPQALTILNAKGEPFCPFMHAQGTCVPCTNTECSRNCTRGKAGTCRTTDGVDRCHHEDHRLTVRRGKRERALVKKMIMSQKDGGDDE